MTTEKTSDKRRTITLFDRPPVRISETTWPMIARADDHDGDQGLECRANRRWHLHVRQHADGRAVVYGTYNTQYQGEPNRAGGELLEAGADVAASIARVATRLEFDDRLAESCVADLPAEDI